MTFRSAALVSLVSLVAACSQPPAAGDAGTDAQTPTIDAPIDAYAAADTNVATDTAPSNDTAVIDAGSDAGPVAPAIYASTDTALYTFDPVTSTLAPVGSYDCIGTGQATAMLDVATNVAGVIYGVTRNNVYTLTVEPAQVVHCSTPIALPGSAPAFYGLAVAPAGVVGATEALFATTTDGSVWVIDATGQLTQHGTLGVVPANDGHGHVYANAGTAWEIAGDLVFARSVSDMTVAFVNVRDCPNPPSTTGCDGVDTLVELDVAALATPGTASVVRGVRGQLARAASCGDSATGYGAIAGLAARQSSLLGFARSGAVIAIDFASGASCTVASGMAFSGAASAGDVMTTVP